MADAAAEDQFLWHQSGVNPRGEPFVQLLLGDKIIAQMDLEQARDHAKAILEASEASETDAFIWKFWRNTLQQTPEQATGFLMEFRKARAAAMGRRGGPTTARDWVMPSADKMPDYGEEGK